MTVAQDLTETEPELFFFVVVGDALDLGDEDRPAGLPGQIEIWLVGEPRSRVDARMPQGLRTPDIVRAAERPERR